MIFSNNEKDLSMSFQREMEEDANEEDLIYQRALKPRHYIMKENSTFRFYWDIFIILLAVFSCFVLPFNVAFKPEVQLPPIIS